MVKVSSRNTRTRCEISSKLTIKKLERRQWLGYKEVFALHTRMLQNKMQVLQEESSTTQYVSILKESYKKIFCTNTYEQVLLVLVIININI